MADTLLTLLFLLLLGGGPTIALCWFGLRCLLKLARSERAHATVARIEEKIGNEGDVWLLPYVRFTTSAGRTLEVKPASFSNSAGYKVGDPLEVFYDPSDPARADLVGFWRKACLVALSIGLPGVLVVALLAVCVLRGDCAPHWTS